MALTIETGASVAGADSFITAIELDGICLDLFAHAETAGLPVKEAAIRRAWYYMKSLNWSAAYPLFGGSIPAGIKTAQGILSHFEIATPGALAPSVTPGQQKVLNRVGEIGWKVTGSTGTDAQRLVVTMADDLLRPYLSSKTVFLDRA